MNLSTLEDKNKKENIAKQDDERLDQVEESKRNAYLWLFVGVLFFLVSILLAFFAYRAITNQDVLGANQLKLLSMKLAGENKAIDLSGMKRRMIDGVYVEEGQENLYPIAAMIDNHRDAWPPAGLSKANLVYEAEAEGGITRYLAVFAGNENIEKIGPVRSARPYFVDWGRELSSLYAHVGGSPEALAYMQKENVLHINEFYNGNYFWRDDARPMPHNVFTSTENLYEYLGKKELTEGTFLPWQFKDDESKEMRGGVKTVYIPFRLAGYKVEWHYNAESNTYNRFLGGSAHQDANGDSITAKNIIIEVLDAQVLDSALRLKMDNIGSGKAVLCLDGFCHEAEWQKNSAAARTRYYDESGSELKLNAGTTWVEAVRPDIEYRFE